MIEQVSLARTGEMHSYECFDSASSTRCQGQAVESTKPFNRGRKIHSRGKSCLVVKIGESYSCSSHGHQRQEQELGNPFFVKWYQPEKY